MVWYADWRWLTDERVLGRQDPDDGDVCGAGTFAPSRSSVDAGVVDEVLEDELGGLVRRRRSEDCYHQRCCADGVPPDRDVVDVLEEVDAEGVHEALADQHACVDGYRDARFGDETRIEGC